MASGVFNSWPASVINCRCFSILLAMGAMALREKNTTSKNTTPNTSAAIPQDRYKKDCTASSWVVQSKKIIMRRFLWLSANIYTAPNIHGLFCIQHHLSIFFGILFSNGSNMADIDIGNCIGSINTHSKYLVENLVSGDMCGSAFSSCRKNHIL